MELPSRSSHTPPSRTGAGFTLIELLVVISIISILSAFSLEGLNSFLDGSGNETAAREVVGVLQQAHAQTLSSRDGLQYGVHFDTTTITLFTGDTYISGHADNFETQLTRATISDVSLTGSTTDIVFSRLRGDASAEGTITIRNARDPSLTKTIVVHNSGLTEVQ